MRNRQQADITEDTFSFLHGPMPALNFYETFKMDTIYLEGYDIRTLRVDINKKDLCYIVVFPNIRIIRTVLIDKELNYTYSLATKMR